MGSPCFVQTPMRPPLAAAELAPKSNTLVLICQLKSTSVMPNSARPNDAVEFLCRSAANGQKRRPISAVDRDAQNGSKGLINNQILDADAAVFEAKTRFSAVDSGIGGGPARRAFAKSSPVVGSALSAAPRKRRSKWSSKRGLELRRPARHMARPG